MAIKAGPKGPGFIEWPEQWGGAQAKPVILRDEYAIGPDEEARRAAVIKAAGMVSHEDMCMGDIPF